MKNIFLITAWLLLTYGVSNATIRYVDSAATGADNGSSWANAYKYLSSAISAANAATTSDTILVAQGTYYPTGNQWATNRNITFLITRGGIKIYGGYPTGGGTSNIIANPTILSGDIYNGMGINNNNDNSYHVMVIAGLAATADSVVADGITVNAGLANGSGNFTYGTTVVVRDAGAGINISNNNNTRIAFRNCTFSGNTTSGGGAAMYNLESAPTIANCVFSGNTATYSGGAVANISSSSTLVNCSFSGNTASSGGAMLTFNSAPTISNCTFSANVATNQGGSLYNAEAAPTISNCVFSGNTAINSGGAVANILSPSTIVNCTFLGNTANNGGAMHTISSASTLSNCTFSGNVASGSGGGMFNDMNSNNATPTRIRNCTFSGNLAITQGGGIYNIASNTEIYNTIISGNSSGVLDNYSTSNIFFSLVQDNYSGLGNLNGDTNPMFVNPQPISAAPTTAGDYRLQPCSPALNFGDNSAIPTGTSNDLDGNPRIFNTTVDMGAYELQKNELTTNPQIIYIDSATGNDANTGTSWGTAFKTLSNALNMANSFSCYANVTSILVARGTYYPTGLQSGTDRDATFLVSRGGLKIYGGYPTGGGTRNITANPTILSGNINAANNSTDNSYHVMVIAGITATADSAVVDGITITAGNANGSGSYTYGSGADVINQNKGAGMFVTYNNGNPKMAIRNCTFSENFASDKGGAMYNSVTALTITGCVFSANTASNYGGAMAIPSSSSTITNCTFSSNASNNGGAISTDYSSPTLTSCTFSGNTATSGGAIYNSQSTPALTNCTFSGNTAVSGGAMYNTSAYLAPTLLTNCTFSSNTASNVGGAMYNGSANLVITNCTISGNMASTRGGGMYNDGATPTMTNCVISGNAAPSAGGAMFNTNSADPFIKNCTISGNKASYGGVMYNDWYASPTVSNSIIFGNNSGIANYYMNTVSITYSLVQGIGSGTGNINGNIDPMFVNPQPASAAPTIAGNYRLQPSCSPAINMGNNSAVPTGITTDLNGNPRIFGTAVDMGAYEYIPDANAGGLPTANSVITNIQSNNGATIYADHCNNLLATITGNNTGTSISGSTTVKVWIDSTQNPQFVKRHYEISPAANAATATGAVKLYFTQAEFNAFNNANPNLQLPQNLLIEKRSGSSSDGSGNANTYPGTPANITPSSVVWNATASRWEVSFSTSGFSGFWVKTQSIALPVTLSSFAGSTQNCTATLSWKTATETNFSHFDIERSRDGIVYQTIGKQSAKGSHSSYSFTDNTLAEGQVMYRLKIVDYDGEAGYSTIVKLNTDCPHRAITVSPNPATDQVVVNGLKEGDRLNIYDAQGRLVIAESVKNTNQLMSIGNLAAGFYIIKVSDAQNGTIGNLKLLKE